MNSRSHACACEPLETLLPAIHARGYCARPRSGSTPAPAAAIRPYAQRDAASAVSTAHVPLQGAVKAGGPLLAILGFVFLPFIWSIPEALVCAELATAFPENSGYVVWVEAAFGPFAGFLEGLFSWVSGVTDNTIYPVMLITYLQVIFPALEGWWLQKCAPFCAWHSAQHARAALCSARADFRPIVRHTITRFAMSTSHRALLRRRTRSCLTHAPTAGPCSSSRQPA